MSSPPEKSINHEDWKKQLSEIDIDKKELNELVMNYLVIEGYRDAAEMFSNEASVKSEDDFDFMQERMAIRKAVAAGNIQEAIEKVNDINPEILDLNPTLYFHLQQQKLIELIREKKTNEALTFAQEELAHRGEENPELLVELERTMLLLTFSNFDKCPVTELLDHSHREKVASELNAAILNSQSRKNDPLLISLLKLMVWGQRKLGKALNYPEVEDLISCQLSTHSDFEME